MNTNKQTNKHTNTNNKNMTTTTTLDSSVWGPHYWFVLLTMATSYPKHPNDVTKKKYYEFIQNLPLFMPSSAIGNNFSKLLDAFPVTPYLDSRDSFIKWVHFIHNRINVSLKKEEISLHDALEIYYNNYKPKHVVAREKYKHWQKIVFVIIVMLFLGFIKYNMSKSN